jgi:5-phospho-D-xylono-1,4-lactonase
VSSVIRTVTGDLAPEALGRTDYHEHLLQASRLLPGDGLDDVDGSADEAARLRDAGIDALVELTPIGLGRDPAGVREIAQRTGLHIVLATGVHREEHYADDHPLRGLDGDALVDRFVAELTQVVDADDTGAGPPAPVDGVRAGVIKVGAGYWSISRFERTVLEAGAQAQRRTGAPLVCHLELGTAAWEVLDLLVAAGASADRIVLAHADRNPDPELHLELAAAGAYLGYDGAGRTKYWPDSVLVGCLVRVAERGGAERILLGGDVARRRSFESYGGLPGMAYLPRRFVPRVAQAGGAALVEQLLVTNPARVFAMPPTLG